MTARALRATCVAFAAVYYAAVVAWIAGGGA
jgi:hypothetical protein